MNRTLRHHFGMLTLCVLCQTILTPTAVADSVDVFPLAKRLRHVYLYHNIHYTWSFSNYTSTTDSGFVECTLLDSTTANDTTVAWTVLEKKNIMRRVVATFPPLDTVYSLLDSTFLTLFESTTGNHELRSSSVIWEFPVSFQNGQEFSVFRFSSVPQTVLTYGFGCPRFANVDYDSLWFSSDSGCFKRAYSRCFDRDEYGWASWRGMRLLSRTLVSVTQDEPLPMKFKLFPNYPNPFNPATTITYDLPRSSEVLLAVYDLLGRQVTVLVEGVQQPGRHEHFFDASHFGSGVYFVRLQSLGAVQSAKMILLK